MVGFSRRVAPHLLAALCLAAFALQCRQYQVVQDDAYISLVYADNLATGHGLVFNPGERVEGYTNFLWTLLLAAPHLLNTDAVAAARTLGALAAVALFAATWWLSGLLGPDRALWWRLPALLLLAANGALAFWTLSGLETALFALLVTLGAGFHVVDLMRGPPRWRTGVAFGLAALTRPEGSLFFGLTVLHRLALQVRSRRLEPGALLPLVGPFLALLAPQVAFRLLYYGYPLPNTFYAKTGVGWGYLADGVEYTGKFLGDYGFWGLGLVAPALLLAWRHQRAIAAYLLLLVVTNAAWVTAIGGDALPENRLHLPVIALTYLAVQELAFRATEALARRRGGTALAKRSARVLAAALLLLAAFHTAHGPRPSLLHSREATLSHNAKLFALVDLIRTYPAPGDLLVASTAIGIPRYFTDAAVLDLVGLTDEVIAHQPEPLPGIRDAHRLHNYNTRYVMDREPDLIFFITGERPVTPAEKALFLSRRFRQEYYASYSSLHPVFVRQDSLRGGPEEFYPSGRFVELYAQGVEAMPSPGGAELLWQSWREGPGDFHLPITWLGRFAYDRDLLPEAQRLFEQALAIDERAVMALAHLAVLSDMAGRAEQAVDLAARALRLSPRSHFCLYAYGRALLSAQRIDEAVEALVAALELGGPAESIADSGYRLGLAHAARKDLEGARATWEAVLEVDPEHRATKLALSRLDGGPPAP